MLDAAPSRVAATARAAATAVTVGFVAAAAYEVLPRLSTRLRSARPDVDLRIVGMTNGEQVAALESGEIDLGLAWLPFERQGLIEVPLQRDSFLVALPADHRLAPRTSLGPRDLRGESLIIGCRTPRIARAIERVLGLDAEASGTAGAPPVRRARDLAEAIDCVAAGLGVTLVPGSMRGERSARVVYRTFDSPQPLLLGAVYGAREPSAGLARFLECTGIGPAVIAPGAASTVEGADRPPGPHAKGAPRARISARSPTGAGSNA
jgi:DNA-binding transcriptional LysR family regulator